MLGYLNFLNVRDGLRVGVEYTDEVYVVRTNNITLLTLLCYNVDFEWTRQSLPKPSCRNLSYKAYVAKHALRGMKLFVEFTKSSRTFGWHGPCKHGLGMTTHRKPRFRES